MQKRIYYQSLIRFMRLSFIQFVLILAALGNVHAIEGYAQPVLNKKVSLNIRNQAVEQVFREIEQRTEVRFVFSRSLIRSSRKVSITAKNQALHKVLDEVLTPLELKYRATENLVIISRMDRKDEELINSLSPDSKDRQATDVLNTDITVTGRVSDEKGEALPGVSILIKGTQTGTATRADGSFSLDVSDETAVLVFSYVGYVSQEVVVSGKIKLEVTLEVDEKSLEEVVVVGYGTQRRRDVTGSVSRVEMANTENIPNTNVSQALRGSVAGVQILDNGRPGQNGSILIRGPRSLSASNDPLIILDGIIFGGSMADINPNDIQSVEVLKDASAAAIYGARAANGVILITSKRGVTEKPTIRFNTFKGVSQFASKVNLFSPERYIEKTLDYRRQAGINVTPSDIVTYLSPSEVSNYQNGVTVDPWDEASQKGRIASYDISIAGRSNYSNYYISASLADEKGLISNDNHKRISFRMNVENRITDWLNIGITSTFIQRDLSGVSADVSKIYHSSPYGKWYHPDGEPTQFTVIEDQVSLNPLWRTLLTDNEEIYNNLFSNIFAVLDAPFLEGLSYRLNFAPNYRWQKHYNFFRQDKHLSVNTTSGSKFNQNSFDWVVENILTYNKRLSASHGLDLTLMYGRNHHTFESTTSNADQFSSDLLGYHNLTLGSIFTNQSTAESYSGQSLMFRANYRFKDKYLLTLTARRDGSSVFAANNKYATFPSGSLAWIISDERFMEKINHVNMLKLRLSYGAVGNQAIRPYQSLSLSDLTHYVFGNAGVSTVGIFASNMGNDNLKWESTYTANAAVDFDLFKSRLAGTVEVYDSKTKDLLVLRTIPSMNGYTSIFTNIGEVSNKGIEISLNTVNIEAPKFRWTSNVAFSHNKNKIVSLYGADTNEDGREDDDISNNWFIGHPITSYFDYVFDGIYQEGDELPAGYQPGFVRVKDLNEDGKIDAGDRTIVGSGGQPRIRVGLNNMLSYGSFSLSVLVNGMFGWVTDFPLLNTAVSPNSPGRSLNQLDAGYWTPENRSQTRPSLMYNNPLQHGWYVSRNFVRIQDVSIAYEVPKTILEKVRMANLRLFVSGKNIHTFTDWPGSDPESGGTSSADLYPMPRSFTAGINLSF